MANKFIGCRVHRVAPDLLAALKFLQERVEAWAEDSDIAEIVNDPAMIEARRVIELAMEQDRQAADTGQAMRRVLSWLLDEIGDPATPKHPSVDAIQNARAALDKYDASTAEYVWRCGKPFYRINLDGTYECIEA